MVKTPVPCHTPSRIIYSPFSRALVLAAALITLWGCGIKRPATDPVMDREAKALALGARSLNQDIRSSKGTGWLVLDTEGKREKFRVAWAVKAPDRARITLLASGIPVETIVADGKTVKFLSHTGAHGLHTLSRPDPDLNPFIHIKVRLSRVLSLLLGQVPMAPFEDAWFSQAPPNNRNILVKHDFSSPLTRLELATDNTPQSLAVLDSSGDPRFQIRILSWKELEGRRIPWSISITDSRERTLVLDLSRFMINPAIKESAFRLTESGS